MCKLAPFLLLASVVLCAVQAQTGPPAKEAPEQALQRISSSLKPEDREILAKALKKSDEKESSAEAIRRISESLPDKDRKVLVDAFQSALKQGFKLDVPKVPDNVSIHAAMLPYKVCKRVFGDEVAENYAVIEVIVSNRSADAALIVQNLFIDYSNWPLGGTGNTFPETELKSWEAGTNPAQVASVESRVVRGELLDAQGWTLRNTVIRALRLAGVIATGYQFSLKERGFLRGIGAFTGEVIPAAETFWPDGVVPQMNRISDFGFAINKVVAKQSAEIIVAFYPISRFLTPGVQKVFKRAPAMMFAPGQVAFDKSVQSLLKKCLPDLLSDEDLKSLRNELKAPASNPNHPILDMLHKFTLNSVRVVVGGSMAVDVDTVAPSVESVSIDGGNTVAVWGEPGQKTGVVHGRFLKSAEIKILDTDKYGISGVEAVADGSTDTLLKFHFTLGKPIPPDTVLTVSTMKRTKVAGVDKLLESNPYLLPVTYNPPSPSIVKVELVDGKIVITGSDFYDLNGDMKLTLNPSKGEGLSDVTVDKALITRKSDRVEVDGSKLRLAPACWTPELMISGVSRAGNSFAIPADPKLISAKLTDKTIVVTGTGFLELSDCKSKLTFQTQRAGETSQAAKNQKIESPSKAKFDAPDVSTGEWSVNILVDGQQKGTIKLEK